MNFENTSSNGIGRIGIFRNNFLAISNTITLKNIMQCEYQCLDERTEVCPFWNGIRYNKLSDPNAVLNANPGREKEDFDEVFVLLSQYINISGLINNFYVEFVDKEYHSTLHTGTFKGKIKLKNYSP